MKKITQPSKAYQYWSTSAYTYSAPTPASIQPITYTIADINSMQYEHIRLSIIAALEHQAQLRQAAADKAAAKSARRQAKRKAKRQARRNEKQRRKALAKKAENMAALAKAKKAVAARKAREYEEAKQRPKVKKIINTTPKPPAETHPESLPKDRLIRTATSIAYYNARMAERESATKEMIDNSKLLRIYKHMQNNYTTKDTTIPEAIEHIQEASADLLYFHNNAYYITIDGKHPDNYSDHSDLLHDILRAASREAIPADQAKRLYNIDITRLYMYLSANNMQLIPVGKVASLGRYLHHDYQRQDIRNYLLLPAIVYRNGKYTVSCAFSAAKNSIKRLVSSYRANKGRQQIISSKTIEEAPVYRIHPDGTREMIQPATTQDIVLDTSYPIVEIALTAELEKSDIFSKATATSEAATDNLVLDTMCAELTPRQAEILREYYVNEEIHDIAQKMKIEPDTVRKTIKNAAIKLDTPEFREKIVFLTEYFHIGLIG